MATASTLSAAARPVYLAAEEIDPLAVWTVAGRGPEEAFSFGLAATDAFEAQPQAGAIWRLDLPADTRQAQLYLSQAEADLHETEGSLSDAELRLKALKGQFTPDIISGGLSFAATPTDLAEPEQELLAMLAQPQPGLAEVSFGLGERFGPDWQAAADELRDFSEQLRRFVGHYAWVETEVGGRLLARTVVTWTGDLRTTWPNVSAVPAQELHSQNLHVSLAARTTMLRTFAVVTGGAITILPLLAAPGGIVLALPAVWVFVKRLRAEWQRSSD